MAKRIKEQVLYDSMREISYDEYVEYCKENDIEQQGQDSEEYYDFVSEQRNLEFEYLYYNSESNSDYWIITGSVGLWCGRRGIMPTMVYGLWESISKCLGRCDDLKVVKRGNVIEVVAYHHDGRNHFEIRALTELGQERYERHDGEISINNRENIKKLPEYLF